MKKILIILVYFFLPLSVMAQENKQCPNPVNQEQAIEIAQKELIKNGRSPDWFGGEASVKFDDCQWTLIFWGKSEPGNSGTYYGDHVGVLLTYDGQLIAIMPGR